MKELLEALKVIKEECKKHEETCADCPMWSDSCGRCCVTDLYPVNWKINEEPMKALL